MYPFFFFWTLFCPQSESPETASLVVTPFMYSPVFVLTYIQWDSPIHTATHSETQTLTGSHKRHRHIYAYKPKYLDTQTCSHELTQACPMSPCPPYPSHTYSHTNMQTCPSTEATFAAMDPALPHMQPVHSHLFSEPTYSALFTLHFL